MTHQRAIEQIRLQAVLSSKRLSAVNPSSSTVVAGRELGHATVTPESHLGIDIVDNREQSRASFLPMSAGVLPDLSRRRTVMTRHAHT
jgi:hypothetical protein